MQPIRAIIFDVDGVIVDSEKIHYQAFKDILVEYNFELTYPKFKKYFVGKSILGGLNTLLEHEPLDIPNLQIFIEQKLSHTEHLYQTHVDFIPQTLSFIKQIKSGNLTLANLGQVIPKPQLAMVTGSEQRLINQILKHQPQLRESFSVIITADQYTHSKPHPESYLKAIKELQVKPHEAIGIEDSPSGIQALNQAEIYSIGITTTHNYHELNQAKLILNSLIELLP